MKQYIKRKYAAYWIMAMAALHCAMAHAVGMDNKQAYQPFMVQTTRGKEPLNPLCLWKLIGPTKNLVTGEWIAGPTPAYTLNLTACQQTYPAHRKIILRKCVYYDCDGLIEGDFAKPNMYNGDLDNRNQVRYNFYNPNMPDPTFVSLIRYGYVGKTKHGISVFATERYDGDSRLIDGVLLARRQQLHDYQYDLKSKKLSPLSFQALTYVGIIKGGNEFDGGIKNIYIKGDTVYIDRYVLSKTGSTVIAHEQYDLSHAP